MQEVDNIIRILKETKIGIIESDTFKIRALSDQTINTASLTKDPDNITVAVLVYALGKVIEKSSDNETSSMKDMKKNLIMHLTDLIKYTEKGDKIRIRKNLERIRKDITRVSGKLKEYIEYVLRKAQINKASKIYEHGISQELTAKLLGITSWELAEYSGPTPLADIPLGRTLSARDRIKLAVGIFK